MCLSPGRRSLATPLLHVFRHRGLVAARHQRQQGRIHRGVDRAWWLHEREFPLPELLRRRVRDLVRHLVGDFPALRRRHAFHPGKDRQAVQRDHARDQVRMLLGERRHQRAAQAVSDQHRRVDVATDD